MNDLKKIKTSEKKEKLSKRCKTSKKIILYTTVVLCLCVACSISAFAIDTSDFISKVKSALQAVITLIGAGLGVWGIVNLLEGYGNDNPGAKAR